MKIYHYDPITNVYISTGDADTCPITQDPLIPAFATDKKPPEIPEGKQAVFVGTGWELRDIQKQEDPSEPENGGTQIITPPIDQNTADLWQAMLDLSAQVETLKGGN